MKSSCFAAVVLATLVSISNSHALTIPTVPIGNPVNAADTEVMSDNTTGYGSVPYSFRMGTTEVTNAQYVEFLNDVAASDPYGLFDPNMEDFTSGGIARSGTSGSYSYAVKAPALSGSYMYDDKPVVWVNWGDAARFANWLHNGQPTGPQNASTTEDGAYTLNGAVDDATLGPITRNPGARWWLPSEHEWYKAAYYDPGAGVYYDYPTGTSTVPNNNLPAADTGNSANFSRSAVDPYPLTDAGAYTLSESPYSTFDQGGNVWEWNEAIFSLQGPFFFARGIRGGSWFWDISGLHASYRDGVNPRNMDADLGFRVATIPEPSSIYLAAALTSVALWPPRRRIR